MRSGKQYESRTVDERASVQVSRARRKGKTPMKQLMFVALTIEPRGLYGADEELRAVGVGASVGHGEDALASVLQLEVLVLELFSVDRLASSAVPVGEVTALRHTRTRVSE
jgi:hypothetical protein